MEWWIIIGVLWIVSEYFYRRSKFNPNKEENLKGLIEGFEEAIYNLNHPSSPVSFPSQDRIDRTERTYAEHKYGNQFMSAEEKQQYLASAEWKALRQQVLARDEHKCKSCNSTNSLRIHHISYYNLGAENLEDLVTLCESCHNSLHKKLGYDRTTIFNIN